MRKLAAMLVFGLVVALAGCVTTKSEGDLLRSDVDQLRTELEQMKAAQSQDRDAQVRVLTSMENRVAGLEKTLAALRQADADNGVQMEKVIAELQILRGELEEARFALGETRDRLGETTKTVQDILARPPIEVQTAAAAPMVEPEKGSTIGDKPIPEDKKGLYDFAKAFYDDGQYEPAAEAFDLFLARHGDDNELKDNAYFWKGEAHFALAMALPRESDGGLSKGAQEKFKKALLSYQEVIGDTASNKHDGALYKSGRIFEELGFPEAPVFYQELIKTHPKSPLSADAKKRLENMHKNGKSAAKKSKKRRKRK